jgi:hypothetical protein
MISIAEGVLRPAVEAYLKHEPMTEQHIAVMRAYLRQWISSPVWDQNPYNGPEEWAELAALRSTIDDLTNRNAIERWLDQAIEAGLDPL